MRSTYANLVSRLDLLRELVVSELKASTAETRLGWLWWLLDPLLMMLIYWLVVVVIFQRGRPEWAPYPIFILCALIVWKHLAGAVSRSSRVLVSREGLIRSIPFPTMILPLSVILSGFFFFLVGLLVLVVASRVVPSPDGTGAVLPLVQLPALALLQLLVVTGICLPVSCYGVIVRDVGHALTYVLRIGFYLSPGLYGVDLVRRLLLEASPDHGSLLYGLYMTNPFAILISGYRDALMAGRFMPAGHWIVLVVEAAVLVVIGYRIYQTHDRRVIKFL